VCVQVAVKVIDLEEEDDEMEEIQRVRSNTFQTYLYIRIQTFRPIYKYRVRVYD
jgi:ribulose bisphosphate carboxylase small subunit